MALVAAFPGGTSMVINAGPSSYFANPARSNVALISFLHAQRRRHLDYLTALTVTKENAGTLLALAQEFDVREFWYGGDRTTIPSFWEFRNLLGDARKEMKNLSLAPLAREIGGAVVRTRQLPGTFPGRTTGPVLLAIDYQGKSLLVIPPAPGRLAPPLPGRRSDAPRYCHRAGLGPAPGFFRTLSGPGQARTHHRDRLTSRRLLPLTCRRQTTLLAFHPRGGRNPEYYRRQTSRGALAAMSGSSH